MKPSGLKSSSKGPFPSDMQGRTERSRPPLKTVKKVSTRSEKLKYKPLTGKVFYLDIPSNILSEKIAKDLKELGGKVEAFLSKDISYLISSKKEAKFAQTLGQASPVPSPESLYNGGNSSSHPSSKRDRHDGSSFKMVDTVRMSRGKSLVEKAIKEQELLPSGSVLSNALSWGVKILHVDDIKNYIDQKKKDLALIKKSSAEVKEVEKESSSQKTKSKLKNPFLKVEDRKCHYRPFYLQLSSFPVVNYFNPKPCSPFDVEKKSTNGQKQIQCKQRISANNDKERAFPVQVPAKHKKRKGYCECCMKKYDDLQAHIETEQHQHFAQSSHYQVVDNIISKFPCDFVELRENTPNIKRRKCSVGQIAPLIGTKTDELKERLKKQDIQLRWYSRKSITVQTLKEGPHHLDVYPSSTQKYSPTSEPFHSERSFHSYHTICFSEAARKVNDNTENGKITKASNLTEIALSTNLVQLPPQKESKMCLKNLPEIYEHCEPISRQNLQILSSNLSPLHTPIQGSEFSERTDTSKPKRKLNNVVLLPAKYLKKLDTNSAVDKDFADLGLESKFPRELSVLLQPEQACQSPSATKDPIELTESSIQSSPSVKLNRKVIYSIGRNKKANQKQNVELCLQQTDKLPIPEETKNVQSPSTQALSELFQTSDANSDFGGFSSIPENKDSSLMKDTWEDQHTDGLWSLFSTSASSSPFIGF
ncbi:protein DBF4 homolog A [Hemicordylus capensis]|uniref:protein DBF4 homolog A n=1 Tax=Hemicordylus capensis TaxID=884348 RepID=UPI0023045329|nr:protein DBF4 homolog A [Hemicordylus capensis]XP_053118028.1 protein DBF4 homolog A [Hemicordylus capensis]XP_053118029.1 protein DBF4 homolog A [Hemicordylus capensis]XP_053118030.1 protein DBF4 homolog A [Hemicordylus capensis]